jgi:hypothetical protein
MPKLRETPIKELHPTQLTIGFIEVDEKKKRLLALKPAAQRDFLQEHPIPAVLGPAGRLYITDHHHLARAALDGGVATAFCDVDADLSSSGLTSFWAEMEENSWVHPLDEHGVRHVYSVIPDGLEKLVDDVYRSLAGFVRDAGGYDKTPTAFAEFVWADFFRRNVAVELVQADFHAAVRMAIPLAQGRLAKRLPGFNGK